MSRDYKNSPKRSRRSSGWSAGNTFTGIAIGLMLGIILALVLTLYLNRSASPFMNKVQQPEPKKPPQVKNPDVARPLESASAPEAKPGEKPRFDFYEILPGDKDPSRRPAENPVKPAPNPPPPPAKAPETHAPPPTASKEAYYLQAGSFRSSSDADNLKARLALMGLEANVTQADVPTVGMMYRVRLGPYNSSDKVVSTKSQLAQNGIQASVVKFAATQNN